MTDLIEQIDALLALNAKGAVSHTVPGLAVELLTKAASALRVQPSSCAPFGSPVPGHWSSDEGTAMANTYLAKERPDLAYGQKTDLELANAIFMAGRGDLELIGLQTAAKERIRWLSVRLAAALRPQPPTNESLGAIATLMGSVDGAYGIKIRLHDGEEPKGDRQEYEGPPVSGVRHEWVDQSGPGFSGDDFSGTVTFVVGNYHLVVEYST